VTLATLAGLGHRYLLMSRKRAKQFFTLCIQINWGVYNHVDVKFAVVARVQTRQALAPESKHCTILGTGFNLDLYLTTQCWSAEMGAECSFNKGNVQYVVKVLTVTLEPVIGRNPQVNIELPVSPASSPRWTLIGHAHSRAIFYARGDLDAESDLPISQSTTSAAFTGSLNARAKTLAPRTHSSRHHLTQDGVADPTNVAHSGTLHTGHR
jgi:hypothetical protein